MKLALLSMELLFLRGHDADDRGMADGKQHLIRMVVPDPFPGITSGLVVDDPVL